MIYGFDRLLEAYARAAECQLTTFEHLSLLKGTSKSALRRHRSLCVTMLDTLTDVEASGVPVAAIIGKRNHRVHEFVSQELTGDEWLENNHPTANKYLDIQIPACYNQSTPRTYDHYDRHAHPPSARSHPCIVRGHHRTGRRS